MTFSEKHATTDNIKEICVNAFRWIIQEGDVAQLQGYQPL